MVSKSKFPFIVAQEFLHIPCPNFVGCDILLPSDFCLLTSEL